MYAMSTAAEILNTTTAALEAAMTSGVTIADLSRGRGLDVDAVVESVVDAEIGDIAALATIAGFDAGDVALFVAEVRAYLLAFVDHGPHAAETLFDDALTVV
jgi:hypothetical protein